ncbi:AlpA family transcriptional regulator [Dyadobacter sp. CY326]|uniref:helix-turn-helix transcriptional regulator n=1 Tax=Dyadobacter sp. CY326 TaxID=2907300 RepID=UPI001F3DF1A9|nr:helix-turn-helix domain-containing protein [Dyadobacter sp. CY326]MCE7064024.1 helix-turn-helix domain-containing protein [Dyadobacter sp. CY326]
MHNLVLSPIDPEKLIGSISDRVTANVIKALVRLIPPTTDPEQYIDTKRVSALLGVSSVTIWDWEKKGILKSYRIGNLKRFKLSEIMAAPTPIKRKGGGNGF